MIELYLGYKDIHTLVNYANENQDTEVIGIDINQEPIGEQPRNLRLIKADFLSGVRDSTTQHTVDKVSSDLAFGYYGRMGHRTWDAAYTSEVADAIYDALSDNGEFRTVIMGTDKERIQEVLRRSGFYVESSPVGDEEAERTGWMKMLQIHQDVPLELLIARCSQE